MDEKEKRKEEEKKQEKKKKDDYHAHSASPLPDHFEDILLAVTKTSSFGTRFRTCVKQFMKEKRREIRVELPHVVSCRVM